ncbi:MAG: hypothetical protein ACJ706_07850, partial [Nitrososphaeraceae archaeon]
MLKTFSSICLLSSIFISLSFTVYILQQQQQTAAAVNLSQNARVTLVHANTSDLLTNNERGLTIDKSAQNSSTISQKQEQQQIAAAVGKNFQNTFCGVNTTTTNSSN